MSIKVTFAFERDIEYVAYALPSDARVGAQYDVVLEDGAVMFAVFWEHEDPWSVIDKIPFTTITTDFDKAIPTLSEVFGLYIPCVQA